MAASSTSGNVVNFWWQVDWAADEEAEKARRDRPLDHQVSSLECDERERERERERARERERERGRERERESRSETAREKERESERERETVPSTIRFRASSSSPLLHYYSRALTWVIQQSMSLKYEPSSEPFYISAQDLFLNDYHQILSGRVFMMNTI